jgi:ubiquinone/menaquinone biosynthesis C-methylase UbiE
MSESVIPAPNRVIASLAAFQLSAALRSAIELDFFVAIADGHRTAEALAAHCKVEARGARILADYLVMNGFLTKQGLVYDLSMEARYYLDRRSPRYLGKPVDFLQAPFIWGQFRRLTECVRDGGARAQDNALQPDHEMWVTFARAMTRQMAGEAEHIPGVVKQLLNRREPEPLKILDVAAGDGMFGLAFAKEDRACRVVAVDWPQVLAVTKENVAAAGVAEQYTMIAGDIRQVDIGRGYDVVLIPNLIHHLDRGSNVAMLKKVRGAMKPGGLVAIVEFAPNDDRISPPFAAFAIFLLATTPAGDTYTVTEINAMCAEAGFKPLAAYALREERLIVGMNPDPAAEPVVTGADWSLRGGGAPGAAPT